MKQINRQPSKASDRARYMDNNLNAFSEVWYKKWRIRHDRWARLAAESEADAVTAEVWFIGKLTTGLLNYVVGCIVA